MPVLILSVLVLLLGGACFVLLRKQRRPHGDPGASPAGGGADLQSQHFALAHRYSNDAVLLIDPERRILDANDRATELYGYTREELCRLKVDELRAPLANLEQVISAKFAEVLDQGTLVFETEHRHRGGRIIPVEVSARRFDAGGRRYVQSFVRDISERQRAEAALRQSEQRFREFVEQASDVVYGIDRDWRFTYITPNVAEILGRKPEEFIGQPFDFAIDPRDRAEMRTLFGRIGTPIDLGRTSDYRILTATGEVRWHSARVNALRNPDGSLRAYIGISRDVTDHHLAEMKLQRSERRLNDAQRIGRIGSWEADPRARRMIWSDETYRIFGVTPGQFDGTLEAFMALIHPDDREDMQARIAAHGIGERDENDEFRCVHPDGSVRHLSGRGQVVRDADGTIVAVIGTVQDVTDRKLAEQALRANETRYRSLFEHASDGILLVDDAGRFLDVNPAARAMFGYTEDEFAHMTVRDLLAPEERERFDAEHRTTVAGVPQRAQWVHRRKDGTTLVVDVSANMVSEGRVLAVLRDQTAAIAAQQEIEHQRNLFDLLAKCNEAIVHIPDQHPLLQRVVELAIEHGKFVFAFYGEVDDDGRIVPLAVHGDDQGYVAQLSLNVREGQGGSAGPTARSIREGRPVLVQDFLAETMTSPWHAAAREAGIGSSGSFPVRRGGQVIGAMMFYAPTADFFTPSIVQTLEEMTAEIGFAMDAMSVRSELEEQRYLMRSILDADPAAIYAYDIEGRAIMGNAAWGEALGGEPGEFFGKPRSAHMSAAMAEYHLASDRQVIERGHSIVSEELFAGRIFITAKFPLRDLKGALYAVGGVSTDITDLRRMQQEVEASNRDLEAKVVERTRELMAAKEMAESADKAKSAFLATMSHELRSPLNSIIGFTSILLEGLTGPLNDAQRKQLQIVNDSSRHLLAIISDLLDISRIEAGSLEIVSRSFRLQPVIDRVIGRFTLQARQKGIEFGQTAGPWADSIHADERRVEQIVANLVSNAVKFTDAGSVQIQVTSTTSEIRVAISDTGTGIAAADQGRLFHHFSQLKPRDGKLREGTGLGLAISDRLARAMGGRITLESEVGAGSTFTLTLPWGHDPGL